MVEIISAVATPVAMVMVAVIELINIRSRKRDEQKAKLREEETRLMMQMTETNCKLATVTALAVTGHQTNGNVEEALEASEQVQREYEQFRTRAMAKAIC